MEYRWGREGPGFELPTPYATENRALRGRAAVLLALALLMLLVAFFVAPPVPAMLAPDQDQPLQGSRMPPLLVAVFMAALGGLDMLQARRQRVLMLAPGWAAPLTPPVPREGGGRSPGAPWLTDVMAQGRISVPPREALPSAQGRGALGGSENMPGGVRTYLQVRRSHLALFAGLALLLLIAYALLDAVPQRPAGLPLVAVLLALTAIGATARQTLDPRASALAPFAVAGLLVLAAGLGAALVWLAGDLPRLASMSRLHLALATALLLVQGGAIESLGLLAGLSSPDLPRNAEAAACQEVVVASAAGPTELMREVDLELHRQWTDGVPNRRYAWLPPQLDASAASGRFRAAVLEETEPRHAGAASRGDDAGAAAFRRRGLWLLSALGLVLGLAGGLTWLVLDYMHMRDGSTSWLAGGLGLALLLGGVHAMRVAHPLWSRIEVESTLTSLELEGRYTRSDDDAGVRMRGEHAVRTEELRLRACTAHAISVFYAACDDDLGSRRLLRIGPDAAAAERWGRRIEEIARGAETGRRGAAPVAARPREASPTAETPPRRAPQYCPACGTPVPYSARFCQHCGSALFGA